MILKHIPYDQENGLPILRTKQADDGGDAGAKNKIDRRQDAGAESEASRVKTPLHPKYSPSEPRHSCPVLLPPRQPPPADTFC